MALKERKKAVAPGRPGKQLRTGRDKALEGLVRARRAVANAPLERKALVVLLLVAALFTGLNMFNFPNYELDEGTYLGSAWSMFEEGKLSYYTYTYDHPLLGWLQVGLWSELVGGFLTFGTAINTGRVLMLVVAVLSTLLVYAILRRMTDRVVPSLLGAAIFAVSPLAVTLHRQVWLDNIATFWLLVSLYALVAARGSLMRIVVSSVAFGLAFWSKEVVVVFLPAMLYMAYVAADRTNRSFALSLWGAATASAMSLFAVLALLKDEFLPPGVLWSSEEDHVSLIETLGFQAGRGGGGSIFAPESNFRTFFGQWVDADPVMMIGGLLAAAVGFLFWRRDRVYFGVSLLTLSFMLLLVRGGVVLHFYVIPLLALLALSIGLLAAHAMNAVADGRVPNITRARDAFVRFASGRRAAAAVVVGLAVLLGTGTIAYANGQNFTGDATSSQSAATRFIAGNLPNENVYIMDAYPWADLRDEDLVGDEPYENAHYYLPATQDPEVRDQVLGSDPRNIDYMLHSLSIPEEFSWIDGFDAGQDLELVPEARDASDRAQLFSAKDWEMELLRVRNLHQVEASDNPSLTNSWNSYKKNFMESGRVVDPGAGDITTSEGQAYAMTRAVYADDHAGFDEIWNWTQNNLQVRDGDALLAWQYGALEDGSPSVLDEGTAADADTDAALALLFAAQRWDDPSYEEEALRMLDGIWEEETTVVDGERYVVAGDWARNGEDGSGGPVVNPSYLAPYAYTIFAEADPDHSWEDLVGSSYDLFEEIRDSEELGGEAGLAPDWLALQEDGGISAAEIPNRSPSGFSFDASRIPWRITLDYLWFNDDRALETLRGLDLPRRELDREGRMLAAYEPDGAPAADYEALSTYAGVLPGLLVSGDPDLIHKTYADKILGAYKDGPGEADAYWGDDPNNYYDQNMAWFATAVMDGSMSNLYAGEEVIDWDQASIDDRFALTDRELEDDADGDGTAGAGLRLTREERRSLEAREEGAIQRNADRKTVEERRAVAEEKQSLGTIGEGPRVGGSDQRANSPAASAANNAGDSAGGNAGNAAGNGSGSSGNGASGTGSGPASGSDDAAPSSTPSSSGSAPSSGDEGSGSSSDSAPSSSSPSSLDSAGDAPVPSFSTPPSSGSSSPAPEEDDEEEAPAAPAEPTPAPSAPAEDEEDDEEEAPAPPAEPAPAPSAPAAPSDEEEEASEEEAPAAPAEPAAPPAAPQPNREERSAPEDEGGGGSGDGRGGDGGGERSEDDGQPEADED